MTSAIRSGRRIESELHVVGCLAGCATQMAASHGSVSRSGQSSTGPVSAGLQSVPSAFMALEFVLQNHVLASVSTPQPAT